MRTSMWKFLPGFALLAALAVPAAAGDFSVGFSFSSGGCYDRPVRYYSAYGPSVYTRTSTVIYRDCPPSTIVYNRAPLDYERVYTSAVSTPRPVYVGYSTPRYVYSPSYTTYTRTVRRDCRPTPRIVYRDVTPYRSRNTHMWWGGDHGKRSVHVRTGPSYGHSPMLYAPRSYNTHRSPYMSYPSRTHHGPTRYRTCR